MPKIITITGGSGSGKTAVSRRITEIFGKDKVTHISHDNFYHGKATFPKHLMGEKWNNYDHIDALKNNELEEVVKQIHNGAKQVRIPSYSFADFQSIENAVHLDVEEIVIVEGIFTLALEGVRKYADLNIFIEVDADYRIARRLLRDHIYEPRAGFGGLEGDINYYLQNVKPGYDNIVLPSKQYANLVVDNNHTLEEMLSNIEKYLDENFKELIK